MDGPRSCSRTPALQGGNLAIVVGGADLDAVEVGTEIVIAAISDIDGLANVTSDLVAAAPTVEVRVDADRAAAAGVSAGQVGGGRARGVDTHLGDDDQARGCR